MKILLKRPDFPISQIKSELPFTSSVLIIDYIQHLEEVIKNHDCAQEIQDGLVKCKIKRLSQSAVIPTKHHNDDAGWDLYSVEDGLIPPGGTMAIGTGLSVEMPPGWYGQIKTRSSHGVNGRIVTAGVIDSSYRGEVKVVVINTANVEFRYKTGDKIAQLLILPVPEVVWEEATDLNDTKRGVNGFGSTGR